MVFTVSGRAKTGIMIFGVWFAIMILAGIAFLAIPIIEKDFSWFYLIFALIFFGMGTWIFFALRTSLKKKTLIIEDGLVSLFIGEKMKKSVHLKDIDEVGTISLGGKTPRGGFYLKKKKKIVFECKKV
jgi:hypothetical protein